MAWSIQMTAVTTATNGNGAEHKNLVISIPLNEIIVDEKFNVRQNYEDIEELADSIKGIGLQEPLVVRKTKKGFELVCGFRRNKALHHLHDEKNAGIPVDCTVKEYESEAQALVSNLAENTGKRDLRTYDKAKRFYELEEKHGMSRKKIAQFAAVSQAYVSQLVTCYKDLAPEVIEAWGGSETVAHEIPIDRLKEWKKEEHETQVKLLEDYLGGDEGVDDPDAPEDEKENTKKGGKLPTKGDWKKELDKLATMKKEGGDEFTERHDGMIAALKWVSGKLKTLK
jgi:ParB/RepB/Spo0J family partition protein